MCLKYCQDKTTIILVVMQANVDISTSEALQMALKLDPAGDRTIGVLTKLDLMDQGTSAKNLLENSDVTIKHGYVALKNRSQQDLNDRLPVNVAIQKEMLFFKSHPVYSKMNTAYFGIENLVDKLRKLFFEHLKLYLPGIYRSIKEKITECKQVLDSLGSDYTMLMGNHGNILSYLNQVINTFAEHYERIFSGKSTNLEENTISFTIRNHYFEFLEKVNYQPSKKIHHTFIAGMLNRAEGIKLSGFPEVDVFQELLNYEYDNIKGEIQLFYDSIYDIVMKTTLQNIDKYFKRFPQLKAKITEIIVSYIEESFKKTKYICNSIVEMNFSYLYIDENGKFQETLKKILGIKDEENGPNNTNNISNINKNSSGQQNTNPNNNLNDRRLPNESDINENYYNVCAFYNYFQKLIYFILFLILFRVLLIISNKSLITIIHWQSEI